MLIPRAIVRGTYNIIVFLVCGFSVENLLPSLLNALRIMINLLNTVNNRHDKKTENTSSINTNK
jgi:hypothetical protein